MKYNAIINNDVQVTTDVASFADEPVTLNEVKRHLNLLFDTTGSYSFDDDDTLLTEMTSECRESLERELMLSLAVKSYKALLRNECGNIEIPYGPITSITSVKDIDGNTLTSGTGYIIRGNQFQWVEFPLLCYLEIEYTAGYTPSNIPQGLKRALLEEIAYRYNHRGDETDISGVCDAAMNKAAPYSRKSILV